MATSGSKKCSHVQILCEGLCSREFLIQYSNPRNGVYFILKLILQGVFIEIGVDFPKFVTIVFCTYNQG